MHCLQGEWISYSIELIFTFIFKLYRQEVDNSHDVVYYRIFCNRLLVVYVLQFISIYLMHILFEFQELQFDV